MPRTTKSACLKGKRAKKGWTQNPNKRQGKGRFASGKKRDKSR